MRGKIVVVIDDDASALGALSTLIRSAGFPVQAFDHPTALLESQLPMEEACLIVDIYIPEMNGVELSNSLAAAGHRLPTILITGRNVLRVVPMAEMTASLAHELNQPLGAILNNAQAARRLLSDKPPDIQELKDAAEAIIRDVLRASDIIHPHAGSVPGGHRRKSLS